MIPPFGFETLYKTDVPLEFEHAEYYQVRFEVKTDRETGRPSYFVVEKHGWFDQHKGAVSHTTTFSPEEGYTTSAEAEARYEEQLKHRASEGFIHSFALDPYGPVKYRCLAL